MGLRAFTERAVRLRGQPFSLGGRPYLEEVYRATAGNLVLRASRQVEKSTMICNLMLYKAYRYPGIQILFVAPRQEQSRLFSNARLRPVLEESSVLRRLLWPSQRKIPVGDIIFSNHSRIFIRSAYHSADGCRGISADALFLDEFQDLAPGALPVLQETLSHSDRAQIVITGTPKLLENPLESVFRQSTACEWHVPCMTCSRDTLLDERTLGSDS